MSLFERLFGKPSQSSAISAEWFFLEVGWAMAPQVFTVLHNHGEFGLLGADSALSRAKKSIQYYCLPQSDPQAEKRSAQEAAFLGFKSKGGDPASSQTLSDLEDALFTLGGLHYSENEKPVIVVQGDSSLEKVMLAFTGYLNRRYVEIGQIPVVDLVYTTDEASANRILQLLQEKKI